MISFKTNPAIPAINKSTGIKTAAIKKTSIFYIKYCDKSLVEQMQFIYVSVLKPAAGEYIQLKDTWYKVKLVSFTYTSEEEGLVQNVYCFLEHIDTSDYTIANGTSHPGCPF